MQTIAANMGGMITPYGNPQNLYLYSYYNIPTGEFFGILFILVILSIFRIIPYIITLIIVTLVMILTDKKRFRDVDYALLATFFVFFIFSGNISRITVIKEFIANIVTKNTMLAGIVSCQFISNVPTAIFLSKFTNNYKELLISVNIGSLGILISSLASLITLKEFLKHQPKNFWKYLGMFTIFNTIFLVILLLVTSIL